MNLKKRLKNGEVVFGTFVKFPSPQMVELLGYAGLDFVILDMEHSLISFTEAENLMRAAAASGMDVIVRVPSAQEEHVLHALDAGAQGVQVPGLTTAEGGRGGHFLGQVLSSRCARPVLRPKIGEVRLHSG